MSIDVFDQERFQTALTDALKGKDLNWQEVGFQGGDLHFVIPLQAFNEIDNFVAIEVNSSIQKNGLSAGIGEDSIRAWIADGDGKPLGSKVQRWVTRMPGWETRLADVLDKLIGMGQQINVCPTCGEIEKIFIVKKDGPNKDRTFKKCCDVFVWLDEVTEDTPTCPDCGHAMTMRESKYGKFWGCRQFPNCRGTRKLNWKESVKEVGHWEKMTQEHTANKTVAQLKEVAPKKKSGSLADKLASVLPTQAVESPMATGKVASSEDLSAEDFEFVPSTFQQAIYNWVEDGNNSPVGKSLVVEAVAGSGKTTTGVKMLGLVPLDQHVLFVAFNKHIAKELAKRAPKHVRVSTYHSLGFKAVRQAFGNVKVDEKKVDRILEQYFDKYTQGHLFKPVKQLVSLVKANLTGTSLEELVNLTYYYGIELNESEAEIFQAVQYVMGKVVALTNVIDFDDMCYFPVHFKLMMDKYDFIFIDEAQDTNKVQIALAMACVKPNTRIVACGDRYQSLYGFRGADVDAIPNLIEALKAETLPLSITYRNPKVVVAMVNERFPHIPLEAANGALDGEITDLIYGDAIMKMASGDMILCRNNAPLVKPAFALIRNGVKAVIRGRDIGKGLISLIAKMNAQDTSELFVKLSQYENMEVAKLLLAEKNAQAESLQDKIDTIYAIAEGCKYVFEVERKIEDVFSDEVEGVVFSTVHKAKGLEADNVFILKPDLMPSRHAKMSWELQQEENIMYVAYTRALKKLVFVRDHGEI